MSRPRQWLLEKISGGSISVVVVGNLRTGTYARVYFGPLGPSVEED